MHRIHTCYKALAVCLSRVDEGQGAPADSIASGLVSTPEAGEEVRLLLLSAFFAVSEKLMLLRNRHNLASFASLKSPLLGSHWRCPLEPIRAPRIPGGSGSEWHIETPMALDRKQQDKRNAILPPEVLELVFSRCRQHDLFAVCLSSRGFLRVAQRFLYHQPQISSIAGLSRLCETVNASKSTDSPLGPLVQGLEFLSTPRGSLLGMPFSLIKSRKRPSRTITGSQLCTFDLVPPACPRPRPLTPRRTPNLHGAPRHLSKPRANH